MLYAARTEEEIQSGKKCMMKSMFALIDGPWWIEASTKCRRIYFFFEDCLDDYGVYVYIYVTANQWNSHYFYAYKVLKSLEKGMLFQLNCLLTKLSTNADDDQLMFSVLLILPQICFNE